MKNFDKHKIVVILAVISLVAFLFMPLFTITDKAETMEIAPTGINALTAKMEVEVPNYGTRTIETDTDYAAYIFVIAIIVLVIAGLTQNVKLASTASIVGFIISLKSLVPSDSVYELHKQGGEYSVGISVWICAICLGAAVYLVRSLSKEAAAEELPQEPAQEEIQEEVQQ